VLERVTPSPQPDRRRLDVTPIERFQRDFAIHWCTEHLAGLRIAKQLVAHFVPVPQPHLRSLCGELQPFVARAESALDLAWVRELLWSQSWAIGLMENCC
jgi:hypothetical protein